MQKNRKSNTPIWDFVKKYEASDISRFHMPGHKGVGLLGCESLDITEIKGADSLYEADGIIAESEQIASELFGSGATFYSAEGSSQCIRAMLYLALMYEKNAYDMKLVRDNYNEEEICRLSKKLKNERPTILAARNVHKAFIYAATLLDFDVVWMWPEDDMKSLCSCHISSETVEYRLQELCKQGKRVAAVYVTSPDYLGGMADIKSLARVCHASDTLLLVDNAHGAYLHFLDTPMHPLDCGADMCCDSAHKTLPVLTGGAYLHMNETVRDVLGGMAKHALCLFGSTSPSYLIMSSLDLCNSYLMKDYQERLGEYIDKINVIRQMLLAAGWKVIETDPLRITIEVPVSKTGVQLAEQLRVHHIECEYADDAYIVFMLTPEIKETALDKLVDALGENTEQSYDRCKIPVAKAEQVMTIRETMFSASETISVSEAKGCICRTPTVSCPPAIPIAVPGEVIGEEALNLFNYYGITVIDVVRRSI